MPLTFVYIKCTIPALPEAVRVSISQVVQFGPSAESTLKKVQREAARRGVAADYEISTAEAYKAHRAAIRAEIERSRQVAEAAVQVLAKS